MAAGNFQPVPVKRCRQCGAHGEFPGFAGRCCPACEAGGQLRLPGLGDAA